MPRYYFHLREGKDSTLDDVGAVFPDLRTAEEYAKETAREMLADKVLRGELVDGERIEVVDESGRPLLILPLKAVLRIG